MKVDILCEKGTFYGLICTTVEYERNRTITRQISKMAKKVLWLSSLEVAMCTYCLRKD